MLEPLLAISEHIGGSARITCDFNCTMIISGEYNDDYEF